MQDEATGLKSPSTLKRIIKISGIALKERAVPKDATVACPAASDPRRESMC